ncbi:MAG: RimK family alpha-L-glutamate ligase [Planctomycetia bacterium]|nr:RimK family alpha-L-glutamate ligase [Planctomycetia bacterium]
MKIALLGSTQSWYYHDICRAAAGRHEIVAVTFRELRSKVIVGPTPRVPPSSSLQPSASSLSSGGVDLLAADCVLVRTMPPGSLEQVVFRMDVLAELERAGRPVINPPRAIEAAVDKYLATMRLQQAGLRVPPTIACQTADDAQVAFVELGGDVVVKPLFGGEGRGIARLTDEALAERTFQLLEQLGAVIYLQQFVPHEGFDLRLLVIGRRVLGIRRRNPLDWRTNVSRGATAEPLEVTADLAEQALRAVDAIGACVAGVDLLPGCDGELYAIEVNAVPGWRGLAGALKVDVAKLLVEFIEAQ